MIRGIEIATAMVLLIRTMRSLRIVVSDTTRILMALVTTETPTMTTMALLMAMMRSR